MYEFVNVLVSERERERAEREVVSVCVNLYVCFYACVSVCVCVWERERERACFSVCEFVHVCSCVLVHTCGHMSTYGHVCVCNSSERQTGVVFCFRCLYLFKKKALRFCKNLWTQLSTCITRPSYAWSNCIETEDWCFWNFSSRI